MDILNQEIGHILFGKGKVICQEAERLTIEFSEQYGTKQFVYPDAFEKHLKLSDSDIETAVQKELHAKQSRLEAERIRKHQEYETSKAEEKAALIAPKRKPSPQSKTAKLKKKVDVAAIPADDRADGA